MLIDEVSIETTAIILWLARQGYSYNAIACDLDEMDIQPPVTGKVLRDGEPVTWSTSLIKQVIVTCLGSKPKAKLRTHPMSLERECLYRKTFMNQSYREIAEHLNNKGKHNVHYGQWTNESVKRVVHRYIEFCKETDVFPFAEGPAGTILLSRNAMIT